MQMPGETVALEEASLGLWLFPAASNCPNYSCEGEGEGEGTECAGTQSVQPFFPEPQSDNSVIRPISLLWYTPHSWHYLHGNRHASMTLRLYFSACLLILGLNSLTCIFQNMMVSSTLLNYLSEESWNSRNQTAIFQTHAMQLITCVQTWAS